MSLLLTTLLLTAPLGVPASDAEVVVRGELGARLDSFLGRWEALGFSGVVAVADEDGVVLQKGYGLADREKRIPVAPDTVFTVGSITKQFTAAAILKLEMQGKVSVEDSIDEYFDGVPADKRAITLHHLLTHTAGLESDFADSDHSPVGRDEYVRRALNAPLIAPPGAEHHYANSGYSLLGAIVELVSGQSYEAYLREALFEPAGMLETGYVLPEWPPERLAHGYDDGEAWGTILERPMAADGPWWGLRANGGIHSTAADMLRWDAALLGDRVLSAEAKAKMYAPHAREGRMASHYGYGWSIAEGPGGRRLIAHNGGNMIFAADFLRFVDDDVVVFAASNDPGLNAIQVSGALARIVFGEPVDEPPVVLQLDPAELRPLAGEYVVEGGETIRVTVDGGALRLAPSGPRGFGLVMGDPPPPGSPQFKLGERGLEAFRASAAGDHGKLHDVLRGGMRRPDFAAEWDRRWAGMREELGELEGVELLGTRDDGRRIETVLVLSFARGTRYVRLGWQGRSVGGLRIGDEVPERRVVPESTTSFLEFDPRGGRHWHMRFEDGAAVFRTYRGEVAVPRSR